MTKPWDQDVTAFEASNKTIRVEVGALIAHRLGILLGFECCLDFISREKRRLLIVIQRAFRPLIRHDDGVDGSGHIACTFVCHDHHCIRWD